MRKLLAVIIAAVATLLIPLAAFAAAPAEPFPSDAPAQSRQAYAAAPDVGTTYHTQEEISQYLRASGIESSKDCVIAYTEQPSWEYPYEPGALSAMTSSQALRLVNNMRFVAGLWPVEWDEDLAYGQQVACVISAANGGVSHSPKDPEGMSLTMFKDGYGACRQSNLGAGHAGMYEQIMGWMADRQDYNINTLGHRRWLLNPTMGKTAYGAVTDVPDRYSNYQSMYVYDTSNENAPQYNVAWPAREMPIEYFSDDTPWSLSLGHVIENPSQVEVVLRRTSDGATWRFSSGESDGPFTVSNDKYGQAGCVIFRPDNISYKPGDTFDVSIYGTEVNIHYEVNFFRALKVKGDLVGAGRPTLSSLILVVDYVHSGGILTEEQLILADINEDGRVTLVDEVLLASLIKENL